MYLSTPLSASSDTIASSKCIWERLFLHPVTPYCNFPPRVSENASICILQHHCILRVYLRTPLSASCDTIAFSKCIWERLYPHPLTPLHPPSESENASICILWHHCAFFKCIWERLYPHPPTPLHPSSEFEIASICILWHHCTFL